MPRKPGAQPGNTNALRHGFYSRQFRQGELDDLDLINMNDLITEIASLRAYTRRMLELSDGIEDLNTAMRLLDSLGASATKVSNIIYRNRMMHGDQDAQVATALSSALATIIKEWKLS